MRQKRTSKPWVQSADESKAGTPHIDSRLAAAALLLAMAVVVVGAIRIALAS